MATLHDEVRSFCGRIGVRLFTNRLKDWGEAVYKQA
jgi:hypothetical protein